MMRTARQFQINKTDLRWINMHPLPPDVTSAVCRLADQAGALILAHYQAGSSELRLANKADDSPLTQADLAAHECITQGLSILTPHIPVVSEEDPASHATRTRSARYWLIDPLEYAFMQRALVVEEKFQRVANYAMNMNREIDMIAHSCGCRHSRELRREHVRIVQSAGQSAAMNILYPYPEPNSRLRKAA